MTQTIWLAPRSSVPRLLSDGLLAAGLSLAALLWRGRADDRAAAAPVNAITHWLWPRKALRQDRPSMQYTATGIAVHTASSLLWAWVYGQIQRRRLRPTPRAAVTDAAAVTALAAVVDLKVVPQRLTPGFEQRLRQPSLVLVYASFAAGLALSGLLALRRR